MKYSFWISIFVFEFIKYSKKDFMKNLLHFLLISFCSALLITSCTKMDLNNPATSQNQLKKVDPNVLDCGTGYHWDFYLKKCVADCPIGYHNDSITGACVGDGGGGGELPIIVSYAGVNITYYPISHTLSFRNTSDVNTVLNQLDDDYENYNEAYENQYPNYTDLQLDSLDSVNNFDELRPYRDFEGNFPGYTSKRSVFENNETNWLNNNMNGADPDSLDYTFDNSENAICNNNYSVIIAGKNYQWTASGFSEGGIQPLTVTSPNFLSCFTNYKLKKYVYSSDQTRRCKMQVAINDCLIRGSAKTKVKSFRKKSNGKWVRSRIDFQVNIVGTFYDRSSCGALLNINKSKGYYKRVKLKVLDREASGASWTQSGQIQGSFSSTVSGLSGTLILQ